MNNIKDSFWGRRTFCLITGASQGIGRNLAIEFGRRLGRDSILLLLARSEPNLCKTRCLVEEANSEIIIKTCPIDLSKPKTGQYQKIIEDCLEEYDANSSVFQSALIVHNAGSVGDVSEAASKITNVEKLQDYFSLNLFSVITLNSEFLSVFSENSAQKQTVINITSLCAVKPTKSLSYYCMGKTSREMFFQVLAEENSSVKVLNYSPGPVNTAMISEIITNIKHGDVKDLFVSLKTTDSLVPLDQTIKRLIDILRDDSYVSGSRIDYFDPHE